MYCKCQSNGMIPEETLILPQKKRHWTFEMKVKVLYLYLFLNLLEIFIDDIHVHVGTLLHQSHMAIMYIFFYFYRPSSKNCTWNPG